MLPTQDGDQEPTPRETTYMTPRDLALITGEVDHSDVTSALHILHRLGESWGNGQWALTDFCGTIGNRFSAAIEKELEQLSPTALCTAVIYILQNCEKYTEQPLTPLFALRVLDEFIFGERLVDEFGHEKAVNIHMVRGFSQGDRLPYPRMNSWLSELPADMQSTLRDALENVRLHNIPRTLDPTNRSELFTAFRSLRERCLQEMDPRRQDLPEAISSLHGLSTVVEIMPIAFAANEIARRFAIYETIRERRKAYVVPAEGELPRQKHGKRKKSKTSEEVTTSLDQEPEELRTIADCDVAFDECLPRYERHAVAYSAYERFLRARDTFPFIIEPEQLDFALQMMHVHATRIAHSPDTPYLVRLRWQRIKRSLEKQTSQRETVA